MVVGVGEGADPGRGGVTSPDGDGAVGVLLPKRPAANVHAEPRGVENGLHVPKKELVARCKCCCRAGACTSLGSYRTPPRWSANLRTSG